MSACAFDPFTWVLNMFSSRSKHLKISNSDLLSNCSDQLPFDNKVRDPILWTAVWCDDESEKSLCRTYATCYMTCVAGSAVLSSALSARCPTNRWSETRETTSYLNGIFMPSRRQDMYAALSCLVSFSDTGNVKSNTHTSLYSIPSCRQDMSANFNTYCQVENGRKMRNYSKLIILMVSLIENLEQKCDHLRVVLKLWSVWYITGAQSVHKFHICFWQTKLYQQ